MTISCGALDTSIECRAIREGVPIGTAAMRIFALAAMAASCGYSGLVAASARGWVEPMVCRDG